MSIKFLYWLIFPIKVRLLIFYYCLLVEWCVRLQRRMGNLCVLTITNRFYYGTLMMIKMMMLMLMKLNALKCSNDRVMCTFELIFMTKTKSTQTNIQKKRVEKKIQQDKVSAPMGLQKLDSVYARLTLSSLCCFIGFITVFFVVYRNLLFFNEWTVVTDKMIEYDRIR